MAVYRNVEGLDDLYRELVAKGAIVSSPPTNKPWGLREFGLHTRDGHRIVAVRRSDPNAQNRRASGVPASLPTNGLRGGHCNVLEEDFWPAASSWTELGPMVGHRITPFALPFSSDRPSGNAP